LGWELGDRQRFSVAVLAVQSRNGSLSLVARGHLDKADSFRAARILVHNNMSGLDHPVRSEKGFQVAVIQALRQVVNMQFRGNDIFSLTKKADVAAHLKMLRPS
jgi:hypothetical protein